MTELKLEVGRVYEDETGRRILIYAEVDGAYRFLGIALTKGKDHCSFTIEGYKEFSDYHLTKLSDNQFPGVVDEEVEPKKYEDFPLEVKVECLNLYQNLHTVSIENMKEEIKALREKVEILEKRNRNTDIGLLGGIPGGGGSRLYYHHHPSYDRDENGNGGGKL